jgi:glucose/arabinose dehydrogenase
MRTSALATVLLLAGCSAPAAVIQAEEQPETEAPNTAFAPAFAGQTRAPAARSGVAIERQQIATGLEHPWALAFLPDGRLLVTERPGRLRVVSQQGEVSGPVAGLPRVLADGQGGLMDIALAPSFAQERLIYWTYSEPRADGNGTSVARGRLSEDAARVENVDVIFRQQPSREGGGHFGSRIVFDGEGWVFVTLGERQRTDSRGMAQDLGGHLGKVVRLEPDGSAVADNPFVARAGARPEIWSYGHRNPQGADLHPETGELWIVEHGPQGGDELNIARAGLNYGWPVISYGEEYSGRPVGEGVAVREGMEQPIYYWDPVIAPGDMDFYRGSLFPWRGDVLIAGLGAQALVRLELDGERVTGEERFNLGVGRIRDLAESDDGAIWIITDEGNGGLYRLTPRR